ncbi:MAG TPA: hypothetical protein VKY73_11115 [Polyangiaceae bacterium]|nr:MAG: hypothetical protein DIU78_15020 [Pseudomonadota bacterium]HLV66355.1 hypothetical protein [Polyangiaceae bacterium]
MIVRRGLLRSLALLLPLLVGPSGGLGCASSCADAVDETPVPVREGTRDGWCYETAPWDGTYLEFPPQRRFEIHHDLGRVPPVVVTYVGFEATPLVDGGNGEIAETAGNIAVIEAVTDEIVRVRNDTCETFYLRVVACAPDAPLTPEGGDAGASND